MAQKEIVNAIAGESLASAQFKFVYVDGSDGEKVKLVGTAGGTATCLGVLQNSPSDDGLCFVAIEGVVEVYAGAAIEPFDYVTSTNAGLATPAVTSGHFYLGRYEPLVESGTAAPDAASGDLIRVRLFANKSVVVPA